MKKLILSVLITLAACMTAVPASAEIYQYRDARGNPHFTDNIAHVPESRRATVKKYKEFKHTPQAQPVDSVSIAPVRGNGGGEAWDSNIIKKGKDLEQERKELDGKYAQLEKERIALSRKLAGNALPGKQKEYAEKVSELNRRIAAYESQRKEFWIKLRAYKEKIHNPGNAAR